MSKPPGRQESEQQWQDVIVQYAHLKGWTVAHFRPGQVGERWATQVEYDAAGFPDLVLVRDRVVFAEVKSASGNLTTAQSTWIGVLTRAKAEVHIWKPKDWPKVRKILS